MKRVLIIAMLMLPAASFAEGEIWYCQEVESAGLHWKNGKYHTTDFTKKRFTIKQDGNNLTLPIDNMRIFPGKRPIV